MRKGQLRASVCVTVVLTVLGLTMIVQHISDDTNTKEVSTIETEADEESPMCCTISTETTQIATSTTTSETDAVKPSATGVEQEDDNKELVQTPEPTAFQDDTEERCDKLYSPSEFMVLGAIQWNGWLWTYYSERVLPGDGLDIPGRHNDDDGYICDENNYICLSSSTLSCGTILKTPFGKYGKVYDTGCASHIIDVYVSW